MAHFEPIVCALMSLNNTKRWVVAISWVAMPMIILNVIDIYARGMNARPQGYFAYWMIPIFDILFFPLFVVVSMKISETFVFSNVTNCAAVILGYVMAVVFVVWFWNMELQKVLVEPSATNWTVDGNGHNINGVVHALIMFTVVQYTVTFFVRYTVYVWSTPRGLLMFVVVVTVFIGVTLISFRPPWSGTPNEILSHFLGHPVNF